MITNIYYINLVFFEEKIFCLHTRVNYILIRLIKKFYDTELLSVLHYFFHEFYMSFS